MLCTILSWLVCLIDWQMQVLRSNFKDLGSTHANGAYQRCASVYTSVEDFALWYADTTPAVGKTLSFTEDPSIPGNFVFDESYYFPLDGLGCKDTGNMAPLNNFAFTSELSLWFNYEGGETFDFRGDDDLWVFINNKLALDLGGLHSPEEGSIDLDSLAGQLGLVIGTNYKLKLFQAERHETGSSFKASTSLIKLENAICPNECNYGSGQGVCDLDTGLCLCCPGFTGTSCQISNQETTCPTDATYGIAASVSNDHCYNTVLTADSHAVKNECGYPDTGTWVDSCYVKDPGNIEAQLQSRCSSDYNNAYTQVEVNYFNATTLTCITKENCGPGFFVSNYNKTADAINRVCKECPDGEFAAGHNLNECSPITDPATCAFVVENATKAHDTVCATEYDYASDGVLWECQHGGQRECGQ